MRRQQDLTGYQRPDHGQLHVVHAFLLPVRDSQRLELHAGVAAAPPLPYIAATQLALPSHAPSVQGLVPCQPCRV